MDAVQTSVAHWLQIIRGEFQEVPGLHLTRPQVQRLWDLDAATCDALLSWMPVFSCAHLTVPTRESTWVADPPSLSPARPWHGDVGDGDRRRMLEDPPDILLTTPESMK
jgi:hypothetical protein